MYRTCTIFLFLASSLFAASKGLETSLLPSQSEPANPTTEFTSAFLGPLFLGETPPDLRTLAGIRIDPAVLPDESFPNQGAITEAERTAAAMQ